MTEFVGTAGLRPGPKWKEDRMIGLVDRMLALHKQLHAAKRERDKELLQRHPPSQGLRRTGIDATDRQIDQLVYELYGLTDREIRIVEEATM